jgi:DNA helicase HerA-like ATPase
VYEETRRRGKTHGEVSLVFVIDEAHHICPNQRGYISIPERCAIELRKYGFSLVTCATRPILVSPNIIANSNTLICHMLNNFDDTETAAGFFMGGQQLRDTLRRLPVGEALVQINAPVPLNAIRCRVGTKEQRSRPGFA